MRGKNGEKREWEKGEIESEREKDKVREEMEN